MPLPRILTTLALIACLVSSLHATPYWTREQIEEQQRQMRQTPAFLEPPVQRSPRATLDEEDFFGNYLQLCEFLTGLQVLDSTDNEYGGMREGERDGDFEIVQTDNTQEAIRVWAQYTLWTGDTATYAANIRAAWEYCDVFPAWTEEGGNGQYYQIHNCGWGVEAVMMYARAYGDTSLNWYADACANRVMNHNLSYNDNLDMCALGLGIGGLYPWGVFRGRQDWQDFAIEEAIRLRTWFEQTPSRLNSVNTWALCGGTALWGVCQSLFTLNPQDGADWLNEHGEFLETWEDQGNWFNSYNCWYSNATFRAWQITGNPVFWNRGLNYANSLLAFDLDDDGGIPPGTCCMGSDTNDHAWVSAYMGWMGMAHVLNAGTQFLEPDPLVPHLAGVSLTVTIEIWNTSAQAATRTLSVTGFGLDESVQVDLDPGESTAITLDETWELPDNDSLPDINTALTLIAGTVGEPPAENDTVVVEFDIRRQVHVTGTIRGEFDTEQMPESRVEFLNEAFPDSAWIPYPIQSGEFFDNGDQPLMEGNTLIRVIPPARYQVFDTTVELHPSENPSFIEIWLATTQILLVDDDGGGVSGSGDGYDTYVSGSLQSLGLASRTWDQSLAVLEDASHVSTIIWITGDESATALEESEQTFIESYLNAGGDLLLSGQNIIDGLWNDPFLSDVLGCTPIDSSTHVTRVFGAEGSTFFDGFRMLLQGGTGANNQTSTSSMEPIEGSSIIWEYSLNGDPRLDPAGIARDDGEGQLIFLGFGIEAIVQVTDWLSREGLITLALDHFGFSSPASPLHSPIPTTITLAQNYPNPFNPSTTVRFFALAGVQPVSLTIFDILGREVTTLYQGIGTGQTVTLHWDGSTTDGAQTASGTYLVTLRAGDDIQSKSMQLLR